MLRLLALIRKDILILLRDKAGLAVLFLMPTALVLVVSLVHDTAIKATQDPTMELLLLNNDSGTLSKAIDHRLCNLGFFQIHTKIDSKTPTPEEAQAALSKGRFKVCIIIPEGISLRFDALVKELLLGLVPLNTYAADPYAAGIYEQGRYAEERKSLKASLAELREKAMVDIRVILDPTVPSAFRETILSALSRSVIITETEILLNCLSNTMGRSINSNRQWTPETNSLSGISKDEEGQTEYSKHDGIFVKIREDFSLNQENRMLPTSTQQNVPAWTMFAMFFIVVPLAGQIITERQNGILKRLLVTPVSYFAILLSKVIVYLTVCLSQFFLMLLVGFKVLPLFGSPQLEIGANYLALLAVALAAGLASTGFGLIVGTVMRNHQQASTFGAVIIIIAAAMGGVMVPVYVMPELMQKISVISPLAWGLNAFLDVFLRNGNLISVLPNFARLMAFFGITISLSLFYRLWRRN